jgi:transcriptional regulator with XRE-family HTH domain
MNPPTLANRSRAEDPQYWADRAILRVAEEVFLALERCGITRAELARRLGTSPAYVTKVLRGNANFTIETLARLAHALDGEFKFHIAPRGMHTRWFDVPPKPPRAGQVAAPEARPTARRRTR